MPRFPKSLVLTRFFPHVFLVLLTKRKILQWKKLKMSEEEKRRVWCAVFFHVVSIICSVWSLYMLIDRMAHEVVDGEIYLS